MIYLEKEYIMGFLTEGKKKEQAFASHFNNVVYSTTQEDINEHWDVMVDGFKYDVKAIKKINRADLEPNENYHYLEILNVNGKHGWVYGKADYIAFETKKYWVIVSLKELQNFIAKNVIKTYVSKADESLYRLYRRYGRKDCITMIKTLDLMAIAEKIMYKKNDIIS